MLCIDHILIAGAFGKLKLICDTLNIKFEIIDLGTVSNFLGMVMSMDTCGHIISLKQEGYIDWVLEKFGMTDCKPVGKPNEKDKLGMKEEEAESSDHTFYLQLKGTLGWIVIGIYPDIAFMVSYLQGLIQILMNPINCYWLCAKRVLPNLTGTKRLQLTLGGGMRAGM